MFDLARRNLVHLDIHDLMTASEWSAPRLTPVTLPPSATWGDGHRVNGGGVRGEGDLEGEGLVLGLPGAEAEAGAPVPPPGVEGALARHRRLQAQHGTPIKGLSA